MEKILEYLESYYPLDEELKVLLSRTLKRKNLRKKDFLLRAGNVCENIYFIEEGLLRCFYMKEEKEVCSWFMKEGDVAIAVTSFFKQIPSYEWIQALEDTVLEYISFQELHHALRHFPSFNFIRAAILEKYYILSEDRLYSMRMHSAAERFDYIYEHYLELVQRVPSMYIASYLGITKEHLSLIKGKMEYGNNGSNRE